MFAQPFRFDSRRLSYDFQMDHIELQSDKEIKRKYSENSLVDFYKFYVSEKYPNLSRHAKRMTALFVASMAVNKFSPKSSLPKADIKVS